MSAGGWDYEKIHEHEMWTIPAERMKMARARTGVTGVVLPNHRGQPFAASTLSHLLKKLDIGAAPHGFCSSFDGWAAERTNAAREVIDLALAHVERNKTRAAYARSDLFERRRRLMEQWAAYLAEADSRS